MIELESLGIMNDSSPVLDDEFIVVDPVHNVPDLDTEAPEEHIRTGSKAPRKLASRRAKRSTKEGTTTASDQSLNLHEASTPNQTGTRSKVQRKRQNRDSSFHLVDEPEDDAIVDERVGSESESQPTNKSSPGEKKKLGRKRKTDSKKTDKTAEKAAKKFSHSTKRRVVDKSLLANPDDIDVKKVSLTNLIRLAEHKERASKKNEAANASQAPPLNHPARDNGLHEYDEDGEGPEGSAFDEDGYFVEEPTIEKAFNYHSHMNKTKHTKWTEKDNELFYEAVQQFGTDFTMIQQLFPGRTRNQVRLKYKKEEKKHPLRLDEAIMNRPQGYSLSDTVIEHLLQKAAEEKKDEENDDDLLNVEEGDADESEARNEEEHASTQIDHDQDVVEDNEVEEEAEDEATEQAYVSEDEQVNWSQYECT